MLLCKWLYVGTVMSWTIKLYEILCDCDLRDMWWTTSMRMNLSTLLYIVVNRAMNENFVIISNLEASNAEYEASDLWERIANHRNAKIYIYIRTFWHGKEIPLFLDMILSSHLRRSTHTHIYIYPSYSQHQLKSYTLLIFSSILVLMLRFLL